MHLDLENIDEAPVSTDTQGAGSFTDEHTVGLNTVTATLHDIIVEYESVSSTRLCFITRTGLHMSIKLR